MTFLDKNACIQLHAEKAETAPRLVAAGADILVSGSYIFKSKNPIQTIHDLKVIR